MKSSDSPFRHGDIDGLGSMSPTLRPVDVTDFFNHFLLSFSAVDEGTYGPDEAIPEPCTVPLLGLGVLLFCCLG